jgi:hypothetical protein
MILKAQFLIKEFVIYANEQAHGGWLILIGLDSQG